MVFIPVPERDTPLAPAAKKKIFIPSPDQPTQPLSPAKQGVVARQKADVITGEEYSNTDSQANWDLYNSTGEPLSILGINIPGIKVQNTTNADGEPRKMILPPPIGVTGSPKEPNSAAGSVIGADGVENGKPRSILDQIKEQYPADEMGSPKKVTGAARMFGGAILDTIKGSVDLAAFLAKGGGDPNLSIPAKAIDDMQKSFDENFPSMPIANKDEGTIKDLVTGIIGYAGGSALAGKALEFSKKALKDSPHYVEWLSQQYQKFIADGKDPAVAMKKLDILTKTVVQELAGNTGIATLTNENTKGMTSEWVQNLMKEQDILSKDELNRVGIFVDNTLFSIGLGAISKFVVGPGLIGIKNIADKLPKNAKAPATILTNMLRAIDTGVTDDMPREELARRIAILGETVTNNKNFTVALLGNETSTELDASTALIMGAKEYMEKVYAEELKVVPPAIAENFINTKAQNFVENVAAIRGSLKSNPAIATSDANVLDSFGETLSTVSNDVAEGPLPSNRGELPAIDPTGTVPALNTTRNKVVAASGESFGKPIADSINSATKPDNLKNISALAAIDDTQSTANLIRRLDEARKQGLLRHKDIQNVVTTELPRLYNVDKEKVDMAFSRIPSVSVDPTDLALAIKAAGDQEGLMKALGLAPGELDAVGKIGDDYLDADGVQHSPVADLAKKISEAGINDLPTLVNNVRPLLAKLKNQVWTSPSRFNKDTGPLDSVIKFIEDSARDNGDQFSIAMDAYKRFSDKWLNTDALEQFAKDQDAVRAVKTEGNDFKPIEEFPKGQPKANESAMRAYEQSASAMTDEQLVKFMDAIRDPENANVPAIRDALVAQALYQISRKPVGEVRAMDIETAVGPLLKQIEAAGGQDDIRMFNDVIEQLHLAENGMSGTKDAQEAAMDAYKELILKARTSAAYDFVFESAETGAKVRDSGSMARVFDEIFASRNALEKVPVLIAKAKAANNKLAEDGLKSQFIRYLQEKTGIKKSVGFKVGKGVDTTVSAVRELSADKLAYIFEDSKDQTLPLLAKVFADDPKTGSGVVELLQIMHTFMNGRTTKVNPFGSQTAIDTSQMSKLVNLGITLGLGVLNPTATKVRGVANLAMESSKKTAAQETVIQLLSDIMTNPKYIEETSKMLSTKLGEEMWKKNFVQSLQRSLAHGMFTAGTGKPKEQVDPENLDVQTKGAFPL